MAKRNSKNGKRFADTFAIFYSSEDKCWVAHSLRTDQFGTGKSILDAFVDGMRAVDQVVALAVKKPGIEVFSEAPEEIQQIARRARPLPKEIYDIAHKQLYGQWPEYTVRFDVPHDVSFKKRVVERISA
jgi:hypothetical protein